MAGSVIIESFGDSVTSTGTTNDTTIIELSDFENSRTKHPPLVTGTVYETELLPEDNDEADQFRKQKFQRYDSFYTINKDNLPEPDDDLDPILCVDRCLKKRVTQILLKNPWLASKIVSTGLKGKLALEFPRDFTEEQAEKRSVKVVKVVTSTSAGTHTKQFFGSSSSSFNSLFGRSRNSIDKSTTYRELAASNAPSAMNVIIADPIESNTYQEIVDEIRPMLHSSTDSVVGVDCSLWNVLLIPLTEKSTSFRKSSKFFLVHSLNSSLADPVTLYNIYGMLSGEKHIEALDPFRCKNLDQIKRRILGGDDPNFMRSAYMLPGIVKNKLVQEGGKIVQSVQKLASPSSKGGLTRCVSDASASSHQSNGSSSIRSSSVKSTSCPVSTSVWTIDDDKIEAIKQQHQLKLQLERWNDDNDEFEFEFTSLTQEPDVAYLSTNDILTSWFLSQNQDAAVGCLLADLRGRDPEIRSDKAGNYQVEIVYNTKKKVEDLSDVESNYTCAITYETKKESKEDKRTIRNIPAEKKKARDTKTPAWIRASLKRSDEVLKRHGDRDLPGTGTLSGGLLRKDAPGATIVSNWSNLITTFSLEHEERFILKPECHLPLLLDGGVHSSIGWNSLVIFRYTEDKLGVLVTAPPSATEEPRKLVLDEPAVFVS